MNTAHHKTGLSICRKKLLIALCFFYLTGSASVHAQDTALPPLTSKLEKKHVLAGKIWSPRDDSFVSADKLLAALKKTHLLAIGEIHDNADHHNLQAWIIEKFIAQSGKKPAIVMEMLLPSQMAALQNARKNKKLDTNELGKALAWEKSGWPDWKIYQSIGHMVLKHELPLLAGDAEKKQIRSVARKGFGVLGKAAAKDLALNHPWPDALAKNLSDDIVTAHCNMIPAVATGPMQRVQRFRDATLADNLLTAYAQNDAAILIAGNGHVRADRAVPWYVRKRKNKNMLVVMIEEVHKGTSTAKDTAQTSADKHRPIADFIIFTPRAEREDPCKQFAAFMKKKAAKGKKPNDKMHKLDKK